MGDRVIHIEFSTRELAYAAILIEQATQMGLWKQVWGTWAHVSAPLPQEASLGALEEQAKHMHSQRKLVLGSLPRAMRGFSNIDRAVYHEAARKSFTVRALLYGQVKVKTSKGQEVSLFASVHSRASDNEIEAVIPNGEVYERMFEMMNRNPAAYLFYYLTNRGIDEDFVMRLLDRSMDPALMAEISDCEWDEDTATLSTPAQLNQDAAAQDLAQQPWMIEMEQVQANNVRPQARATFRIDDHNSLGTMHPENANRPRARSVNFNMDPDDEEEAQVEVETVDSNEEDDNEISSQHDDDSAVVIDSSEKGDEDSDDEDDDDKETDDGNHDGKQYDDDEDEDEEDDTPLDLGSDGFDSDDEDVNDNKQDDHKDSDESGRKSTGYPPKSQAEKPLGSTISPPGTDSNDMEIDGTGEEPEANGV